MKKMQMILLALGLGLSVAMFSAGCGDDDEGDPVPTEEAPNAPTSVQAGLVAPTVVRVTWVGSAVANHPEGYVIERRPSEGTYNEIASVNAETLSYDDSTATRGVTYQYRVGAYNEGGTTYSESAPSVTTPTYQESLVGIWWDENAFSVMGTDSVKFQFMDNNGFRRTEYYTVLDAELWEEGTYSAGATSIEFHVTANDEGAADTTYTWNYELSFDAESMTVEHDYNEGPTYSVDYVITGAVAGGE
jgi:hypothetical protein